jgi:hypothetical protein
MTLWGRKELLAAAGNRTQLSKLGSMNFLGCHEIKIISQYNEKQLLEVGITCRNVVYINMHQTMHVAQHS